MNNSPSQPTPPSGPTGPQTIQMLKILQDGLEVRLEIINHQTTVLMARYTALRDKGFTEEQAVWLCLQDWNNAL